HPIGSRPHAPSSPTSARHAPSTATSGSLEREPGRLASAAGGEQLRLVPAPRRNLLELGIGVDDADDLGRIAARLARLDVATEREARALRATEPVTGIRVVVEIAERIAGRRPLPPLLRCS